ncbi:MAG: peptidyl-prolyl cis-trans isomerase [Pseudomonadota bacterium]|nr:peptidyl-prolyl cis-trans isomerase [Pseudomonadota bacterium]
MSVKPPTQTSGWRDFGQISGLRSMALMAGGAVAGLLLAGYALFTARGTSTLVVPAEDVALVNQQPISRTDYLGQLQTFYNVDLGHATAAERKKVLDDMIREELFVQRGKELDVASIDPEVRSAMVNAVELEIAANALTTQPSEAKLRAAYAARQSKYASEGTMTVRDWVFPSGDPSLAARAVLALKGAPPTAALLAGLNGKDSGKVDDEEFYFAAKIHLGDKLFEAARNLPDGGVSAPIVTPDGIHVLYMVKNRRPVPFDFDAAREQVLNDYRNDAINRVKTSDEAFLRKRANVLIAEDMR